MATTKTKNTRVKAPAVSAKANPERRAVEPHEILTCSGIQNAVGIHEWGKFAGEADLSKLAEDVRKYVTEVADGNMRPIEAMLYGQALALQTMFTSLSRRAVKQDHLKQFQTHLTLALKAQAQCRATLEALAEIKNPRQVHIVKQANMGHNVQVNNGAVAGEQTSHAERNRNVPNQLLEAKDGEWLDARAQSKAGRADRPLEAVGAVNRT